MSESRPPAANQLPKFVGKYKIIRMIARSNDIVYEAIDPNLGRHVALKELVLAPDITGAARRERIERFQREAKAAGALKHPNIVTIYEVGQHLDHRFIAMEYLEGQTLRQAISVGGPMSLPEALRISTQLCDALGYAHTQGVVHRDVKPDNIHLIPPNNTVKLTDFGIARVLAEPSITSAGQVFGTPSYMSPEQLTSRQVDHRSDIFSTAVVIYEMLVGKKPFRGDNVVAVTYQIMNVEVQVPSTVPAGIAAVLVKALAKDPDQRYQNMRTLAVDLRREMQPSEIVLRADPYPEPGGKTVAAPARATATGEFAEAATIAATNAADFGVAATEIVGRIPGGPTEGAAATHPKTAPNSLIGAMDADERVSRAVLRLAISVGTTIALICLVLWGTVSFVEKYRAGVQHQAALSYYRRALASASGGDLPSAINLYTAAMNQVGSSDPIFNLCQRGISDCYTAEGAAAQTSGDVTTAEESYMSAFKADPTNPIAHFDQATFYQARGEQIDALNQYVLAYQDDPLSIVGVSARQQAEAGYLSLGEQDFSNGNLGRARENWQHVIDLDRGSTYAEQARERMAQINQ
jgi:tetratricopeptide (TPR) repeat protein/predicted Ser/Thr protein kinase